MTSGEEEIKVSFSLGSILFYTHSHLSKGGKHGRCKKQSPDDKTRFSRLGLVYEAAVRSSFKYLSWTKNTLPFTKTYLQFFKY